MSATTLFEDLVAAGPGYGGVEAGVQADPGLGIVFGGHGGHDVPQAVQFLGGAALGGETGGGHFDMGAGFGEVPGGVLAQDEVLGHLVGDHKRALAGLRDGQPECVAGPQRLPDHRAAHPVRWESAVSELNLAPTSTTPASISRRSALKTASAALSRGSGWLAAAPESDAGCPAVRLSDRFTPPIWHGSHVAVNVRALMFWRRL